MNKILLNVLTLFCLIFFTACSNSTYKGENKHFKAEMIIEMSKDSEISQATLILDYLGEPKDIKYLKYVYKWPDGSQEENIYNAKKDLNEKKQFVQKNNYMDYKKIKLEQQIPIYIELNGKTEEKIVLD